MANKVIQLSDGTDNLYPQTRLTAIRGYQGGYLSTAGTTTFTLVSGMTYLLTISRNNSTNANMTGLYLVQAHSTNSAVRAIAASSVATVSISSLELTITTNSNYVGIGLMPMRDL